MSAILERLNISMPTAIATVAVVALWFVLWLVFRFRRPRRKVQRPTLTIDLNALPQMGPLPVGPQVTLHGVPMRLAVVVIAPAGRGDPPPDHDIPTILDEVIPGIKQVIAAQDSLCRGWPGQLSADGFCNTFFTSVRMPGDKGKGTPWCELAGRATSSGQKYLIGMVLRAAAPNAYGLTVVDRESQWLDLLCIKH